jgi:hypothetical protein
MSASAAEFESLLRQALSPVEPPEALVVRLEGALLSITQAAQDELESWELVAMRDPRNWVRPAAAAVVGASAGTALVVLRVRSRQRARRQQPDNLLELASRTARDVAEEARRLFPRR